MSAPTERRVKVEGMVLCRSDDHGETVHREGDTDPYGYGRKVCRLSDHRPLYWFPRQGDRL